MSDTLSVKHPLWPEFLARVSAALDADPCSHGTHRASAVLKEMGLAGAVLPAGTPRPSCDCELAALAPDPAEVVTVTTCEGES